MKPEMTAKGVWKDPVSAVYRKSSGKIPDFMAMFAFDVSSLRQMLGCSELP
jgi:hypothetical protein